MRPLDEVGVLGEDLHDRGVGKVEPGIFNHRACEITAEVIEEELIVLHILIKFGPANIGTMQARTAYDGGNVRSSWQKTYRFRGKIDKSKPLTV